MSLGRPISEFGQHTCPKCGAVQESPGSTVCEQCGQDLTLAAVNKPSAISKPSSLKPVTRPKSSPQVGLLHVPLQLLRRVFWTLQSIISLIWRLISLTLRTAVVLLVLGALAVGASYVPEVRARVPVMKEAPRIAKQALLFAGITGSRWLESLASSWKGPRPATRTSVQRSTSQPPRTFQPAVTTQKPVPVRTAAAQPFTVRSSPAGAVVHLNSRQAGKTPVTLRLAPGTYKVMFSRPGYRNVTRTVTVRRGKAGALSVTLVAVRRAPKRTPPAPVVPPPRNPHGREP